MKRILLILCAAIMTAGLLCACDEDTKKTVGDDLATIASQVKDNVDGMIEDGTVRDGDGHIGENQTEKASEATRTVTTEEETRSDNGAFDDEDDLIDEDPSDSDVML